MPRTRSTRTPAARQGVVLLVVISLLVLFFVVGLAFVIYSSAQATNARVFREAETVDHPDMDPEMLLSYFMGQLIYGTTNPNSALAASPVSSCLGPNMYGTAGGTVPYAGGPNGGVPYTYPDRQNLYLAAIKAGNLDFYEPGPPAQRKTYAGTDGAVLIPSYARYDPAGGGMQRLGRPASLPAPADPLDGDVKNLTWSPGFFAPGSKNAPRFLNNDSHWMDLGFAVTTSPDGRRYKPLFAPLIIDLDNKVNVNVHGNVMRHFNGSSVGGTDPSQGRHASHQGWGPWEVNLEKILTARDNTTPEQPNAGGQFEARRIFIGDMDGSYNRTRIDIGRYNTRSGNVWGNWGRGDWWVQFPVHWAVRGPFYMPSNYDANNGSANGLPQFAGYRPGAAPVPNIPAFNNVPSFTAFPYYSADYDGGKRSIWNGEGILNHALKFDFFYPTAASFFDGEGEGRIFDVRDMEAVLRHGDTNSSALRCDLFHACPLSLADPKARRLISTHAFDWDLPGVVPNPQPDPADVYRIDPAVGYPRGTSANAQPTNPTTGVPIRLGRVNLNRDLARGVMGNMRQQHEDSNWWYRGAYPPMDNYPGIPDPLRPTSPPVILSTGRVDILGLGNLATGVNPAVQYVRATSARYYFAKDVFDYARLLTGAPDPNDPAAWAALTPEQKDALRWLAQLSVNIVDFIDIDENITPFRWKTSDAANPNGEWVFGTELPRLVVNEVYGEIVNHKDDEPTSVTRATKDYRVRFWVELHNPLYEAPRKWDATGPGGTGLQTSSLPLAEGGAARLWVPDQGAGKPGYAPYKVVVCGRDPLPADPANVRGEPNIIATPDIVKCEVDRWYDRKIYNTTTPPLDPEPMLYTQGQAYPIWQQEINLVRPMDKYPKGADEDNYGYYVAGPMEDFPSATPPAPPAPPPAINPPKPKATLRIKTVKEIEDDIKKKNPTWTAMQIQDERKNNLKVGDKYGLAYELPKTTDPASLGAHSVLLQRLCTPSLPPNNDPNSPLYNPYVTVDYMLGVPVHDRVRVIDAAANAARPAADIKRFNSVGRSQPYAAHVSQQVKQRPFTQLTEQPQHTFFDLNVQKVEADPMTGLERESQVGGALAGFPFHWLCHADRPLISPVELLEVSCFKPYELTQKFAQGPNNPSTNEPTQVFKHRAPWFDPAARLYRLFEILTTTPQLSSNPTGGRVIGRININTIFDREMFHALCDPQACNFFTAQDVDKAYDKLIASRSPNLTPSMGDQPFRGLSFDPAGGIDDTLFRMDPSDARPVPPEQKRRLLEPEALNPANRANRGHPYAQYELMRKIFNNVTTRSNVFAVFLTVGFFEVNAAGQPVAEVRKHEGRHVRHRMFAVVDRSNLSIAATVDPNTLQPVLNAGVPGPRPITLAVSIPPVGIGPNNMLQLQTPGSSGSYEGVNWTINNNGVPVTPEDWIIRNNGNNPTSYITVDSGINQEIVRITSYSGQQLTANYTKFHSTRVAVGRADTVPGYPGPQSRFDIRNPIFKGIVRYFSITE
jgi:hypothetical protein